MEDVGGFIHGFRHLRGNYKLIRELMISQLSVDDEDDRQFGAVYFGDLRTITQDDLYMVAVLEHQPEIVAAHLGYLYEQVFRGSKYSGEGFQSFKRYYVERQDIKLAIQPHLDALMTPRNSKELQVDLATFLLPSEEEEDDDGSNDTSDSTYNSESEGEDIQFSDGSSDDDDDESEEEEVIVKAGRKRVCL
jgi:hypothetical protein